MSIVGTARARLLASALHALIRIRSVVRTALARRTIPDVDRRTNEERAIVCRQRCSLWGAGREQSTPYEQQ